MKSQKSCFSLRDPPLKPFNSCLLSGLWGLVNNAGVSAFGEVEFTSIDKYKEVADVNLWGTVRVTKAFLPLVRRAKGTDGIWHGRSQREAFQSNREKPLEAISSSAFNDTGASP